MDRIKLLVTNIRDHDYDFLQEILSGSQRYELIRIPPDDLSSELLQQIDYHVLLTDLKEGGATAVDLLRKSKTGDITKPVIALTHQKEKDFDLTLKVGATGYLMMSDLTPEILDFTLKQVVEKSKLISDLHDQAHIYRMLFQSSIDAIYMVDRGKKFTDVNPAMLELLGYSKKEMLQMHLKDIFDSQSRKGSFKTIMEKDAFVKDFEAILRKKNNEKLYCIINSVSLKDINNEITGYQGIVHDMTIRKKAEQELIKSEKLAITGRMSRSIAHEVRNPLTNINLALEQLEEEFPDNDMEFFTNIISRSCQRIDNLVNQLMQTTKLSDLELKDYPVNRLMDESLQLVSDSMQLKQVRVIKDYNAGLISIKVDPQKVRTAILNLLVNALDAVPEKQGILIVSTNLEDDKCIVSVEDNGPGIKEDQMDHLFDPFYTGKRGGMGLGLTTTQNIIESHKGNICVKSEVGKGTRFIITFDLRKVKNNEAATLE